MALTYADVVAAALSQAGVEYVFGVPGSLSSVELIEAAARRDIRYVLCSNESSAAVMGGVYGVMRNRPGVVSTGVGPGAAAAVHGTTHLMLERAPALILTDRFAEAEYRRLPRQRVDQPALYKPITKGSFTLSALDAPQTLERAIDLAMSPRQGPVHVDLPYDVMQQEAPQSSMPAGRWQRYVAPAGPNEALAELGEAINSAARPALIGGLGINRAGRDAEAAFAGLAEKLRAPVFTSMAAKGLLPEMHDLSAGIFRGVASEETFARPGGPAGNGRLRPHRNLQLRLALSSARRPPG